MSDVETDAQPRVTVLDVVPNGGGVGIKGHIRPMQMDGIANACLLDFLLHAVEHIVARSFVAPNAWNTHYEVHANSLSISESLVHSSHVAHIDRSHGIACHIRRSQLLLELGNLLGIGIDGQMEILDAKVVHVNLLHEGERLLKVELHESIACHAEMKVLCTHLETACNQQTTEKKCL